MENIYSVVYVYDTAVKLYVKDNVSVLHNIIGDTISNELDLIPAYTENW